MPPYAHPFFDPAFQPSRPLTNPSSRAGDRVDSPVGADVANAAQEGTTGGVQVNIHPDLVAGAVQSLTDQLSPKTLPQPPAPDGSPAPAAATLPTTPQTPPTTNMFAPLGSPVTDPTALAKNLPASLQSYAPEYVAAGTKYGVDPALLAAISLHETGNGTSHALLAEQNAMGISDNTGPVDESKNGGIPHTIDQMAERLGQSSIYAQARKDNTIASLAHIYAPVGAENDPRGYNASWADGVSFYHKKLSS